MKSAYFTVRPTKKRGFKSAHFMPETRASHAGRNGLHMVPGQRVTEVILADRVLTAWKHRLFFPFL